MCKKFLIAIFISAAAAAALLHFYFYNNETSKVNNIADIRAKVWNSYVETISNDPERKSEFENKEMKYGTAVMRYEMLTIGEAPEEGYPLYIALHGGGAVSEELHEQQWNHMKIYYSRSVKNGIYIAVRGIRRLSDVHSQNESYPLYDRLIENMVLFANVDPNRVYIMGFSAGGDGVYQITPRMADRFAAANASAGNTGNVSVLNLRNLPLLIQVGEKDTAYSRHLQAVVLDLKLDKLEAEEGGYYHETFIHFNKPHNFLDNDPLRRKQAIITDIDAWWKENKRLTEKVNTNAVDWVSQFQRNPYPENITWDLSTFAPLRECKSFYWLRLEESEGSLREGVIRASLDKEENCINVNTENFRGMFTVLLNEKMLDLDKTVIVKIDEQSYRIKAEPTEEFITETTYERGDINYQFAAGITFEYENDKWNLLRQ